MTQEEVDIMQERKTDLEIELSRPDLTMAEATAVIDELVELDTAMQRYYAPLDTINDARLCAKYGVSL
jgi:hypothetical protein